MTNDWASHPPEPAPPTDAVVLVADDEKHIREVVQYALEQAGFRVRTAANGQDTLRVLAETSVDLIVLDILMPDVDGLEICRQVRRRSQLPIVFVSSRAEELDRVLGLELGGDDYLTKPFSPRELVTRVKAVLRRARPHAHDTDTRLVHGSLVLDWQAHELLAAGQRVELTVTEFRVLYALVAQPGRVFTRSQLISRAYPTEHHVTERSVDTHVRRVRAKVRPLACDPIETVHGLGYRARPCRGEP